MRKRLKVFLGTIGTVVGALMAFIGLDQINITLLFAGSAILVIVALFFWRSAA